MSASCPVAENTAASIRRRRSASPISRISGWIAADSPARRAPRSRTRPSCSPCRTRCRYPPKSSCWKARPLTAFAGDRRACDANEAIAARVEYVHRAPRNSMPPPHPISRDRRLVRIEGAVALGPSFAIRATVAYKRSCCCATASDVSAGAGLAQNAAERFAAAAASLPDTKGFAGMASWLVEAAALRSRSSRLPDRASVAGVGPRYARFGPGRSRNRGCAHRARRARAPAREPAAFLVPPVF